MMFVWGCVNIKSTNPRGCGVKKKAGQPHPWTISGTALTQFSEARGLLPMKIWEDIFLKYQLLM